jgi:2-polyprenyl-3-methyl-5-hydroxy-6-metoxy-1,4-benzoquinol methylase
MNGLQTLPTAEQLSAVAKKYYSDGPFLRRKLMHMRPYICPFENLLAQVPTGAKVLDIGCGSGLMLCLLGSRDPELRGLGVDVSEGAVQMAKDMARKIAGPSGKPELDFQVLDAAGELPPGTYDVVILADVLHHIPVQSQRDAVLKAARLVRPGGIFLYKDMCRKPAWRALMNRLHDLVVAQQWIHYVAVQQVENWVRDAGLTLTTAQDLTRFWYGHELRVFVKSSPAAS